jgi:molybdopterin converting factor small subunit
MPVKVSLFAAARAAAGTDSASVSAGTLAAALEDLRAQFPELENVLPRCSYLLDGTAVHGDRSAVTIPEGSTLDVLPPFAGG